MYKVYFGNKSRVFSLFERAKEFAKLVGSWYYIAYKDEIVYTQDDQIFEELIQR